jgi:hypothetical protein
MEVAWQSLQVQTGTGTEAGAEIQLLADWVEGELMLRQQPSQVGTYWWREHAGLPSEH